ncbi:hypothetical protein CBR_g4331 [Chara braunii]|uniref:Uncharacterized protein n=1 Tax=Chara braunii TaxID=69332 RepID=A0A388JRG9_CHABU|nr:hypothetical protein CBR_g4331 [Chara braunii]|eukprot:GBG60373.1 hypothetical protein CBR_g4331 [Chara braunii]
MRERLAGVAMRVWELAMLSRALLRSASISLQIPINVILNKLLEDTPKSFVGDLSLSISLGVIGGGEAELGAIDLMESTPEVRSKAGIAIRDDASGKTVMNGNAVKVLEHRVHSRLESGGGITETERHDRKLVVPETRTKSGLGLVLLGCVELVISATKIDLREEMVASEAVKQINRAEHGKVVLDRVVVESAVVNTETKGVVLLAIEENRGTPWGSTRLNEALTKQLLKLALEFLGFGSRKAIWGAILNAIVGLELDVVLDIANGRNTAVGDEWWENIAILAKDTNARRQGRKVSNSLTATFQAKVEGIRVEVGTEGVSVTLTRSRSKKSMISSAAIREALQRAVRRAGLVGGRGGGRSRETLGEEGEGIPVSVLSAKDKVRPKSSGRVASGAKTYAESLDHAILGYGCDGNLGTYTVESLDHAVLGNLVATKPSDLSHTGNRVAGCRRARKVLLKEVEKLRIRRALMYIAFSPIQSTGIVISGNPIKSEGGLVSKVASYSGLKRSRYAEY